jgi:hypothetical protein
MKDSSLSPAAVLVVVLLLLVPVWVLNVAEILVGGMAWLVVQLVLLDALQPAPAVGEHGHETCRLVPIHSVLTFLNRQNKRKKLNTMFKTSLNEIRMPPKCHF